MRFSKSDLLPACYLLLVSSFGLPAHDTKTKKEPPKDSLMAESGFGAFIRKPVPAVRIDDPRRVWSFLDKQARDTRSQGGAAVGMKLLAVLCAPKANVLAVFFSRGTYRSSPAARAIRPMAGREQFGRESL